MGLKSQLNLLGFMLDKLKGKRDAMSGNENWLLIISELSRCLSQSNDSTASKILVAHLPDLVSLRSLVPASETIAICLAHAAEESVPLGCNGTLWNLENTTLNNLIKVAESRWATRLDHPSEATNIQVTLREKWTQQTSKTISCIMYRSLRACDLFREWLVATAPLDRPSAGLLAPAIFAFLDSGADGTLDENTMKTVFEEITEHLFLESAEASDTRIQVACLSLIFERTTSARNAFLVYLCDRISALTVDQPNLQVICLTRAIGAICKQGVQSLNEAMMELALKWCTRYLSDNGVDIDIVFFDELGKSSNYLSTAHSLGIIAALVRGNEMIAGHYAEPVISIVIRQHLLHTCAVTFAADLTCKTRLKVSEPINMLSLL